jgi:beta-glucosidase
MNELSKPEDVTGSWEIDAQTAFGVLTFYLAIEQEGQEYAAFLSSDMLGKTQLDIVALGDNQLVAQTKVRGADARLEVAFADQAVSGTLSLPQFTATLRGRRGSLQAKIDAARAELQGRQAVELPRYSPKEIDARVESILAQMTLEEKVGQLYQISQGGAPSGPGEGPINAQELIKRGKVGSILGVYAPLPAFQLQKVAVEESRLGIPLLFMSDVIHGFKTIYPIPLAAACSWDMPAIVRAARMAAKESAVSGIDITFAPMLDLVRDPRWGRVMESPGEDPYLGARFAESCIKGFQGESWTESSAIGATAKHYVAYGAAEGGRDYNTVDVSERVLREFYLPSFKAAAEAGVSAFMTSFNIYDGVPATGNKFLMKQVLRGEWGFEGILVSDHSAVKEMVAHGVAADLQEAGQLAMEATLDIEMVTTAYSWYLEKLVQEGKIRESQIDAAVRRVLRAKVAMGLFDDPYRHIDFDAHEALPLSAEHRAVARDLARKSLVLLKNDPIGDRPLLPLEKQGQRFALVGPYATRKDILGFWSAVGDPEQATTLAMGIEAALGGAENVSIAEGCEIEDSLEGGIEAAVAAAREADVVILALGESSAMSGEAASRADISLPAVQQELTQAIVEIGKPTVLVLFNGRPLILDWFHENVPAILEAWFPGTEGGHAVADVLFGDYGPSGKLAMSFPRAIGQIPVYYNHYSTGRPLSPENAQQKFISKYLDCPNDPLYPFGYGLSYTTFAYSDVQLSDTQMRAGEAIEARVTVTNTGDVAGQETVQLYVRDLVGSVVRPVKELKGFQKVDLAPGESGVVRFAIAEMDLAFHTADMSYRAEPGRFKVYVGGSSVDVKEAEFELVASSP